MTKDTLPLATKRDEFGRFSSVIDEALEHPMSTEHRARGLAAVRGIVELLGLDVAVPPIPMILTCPSCNARHIDEGEFAIRPHHTHACQGCGMCWRPAIVATCGVQFLPGFKNDQR